MQNKVQGELQNAGRYRVAVVISRYNWAVGERLLDGAMKELARLGVATEAVTVVSVPGAFEIPGTARELARASKADVIIALGCVIRGETSHYDYVAGECSRGIAEVILTSSLPIAFGVLTTENFDQAMARSGGSAGHKGIEAAQTAMEMADVYAKIRASS